MEMQIIPQGLVTFLIEAQIRGEDSILTKTGVGTFVDPRVGNRLPRFRSQCRAARRRRGRHAALPSSEGHHGRVQLARRGPRRQNLREERGAHRGKPGDRSRRSTKTTASCYAPSASSWKRATTRFSFRRTSSRAIAYYPGTEQTGSIPHRKYWSFLTTDSKLSVDEGIQRTVSSIRFSRSRRNGRRLTTRSDVSPARSSPSTVTSTCTLISGSGFRRKSAA